MNRGDVPTILFIPSVWVERAFDATARTGQPVELVFFPAKINRRSFERQETEAVLARGERRAECRTSLLDLLETNGKENSRAGASRVLATC